jgi:hypothetical protein
MSMYNYFTLIVPEYSDLYNRKNRPPNWQIAAVLRAIANILPFDGDDPLENSIRAADVCNLRMDEPCGSKMAAR